MYLLYSLNAGMHRTLSEKAHDILPTINMKIQAG